MVRELAELVDRQVAVLDGARGTMVQSKQPPATDYRYDGHPRDTAGDPDILRRARRHHLRPESHAVTTGVAEHNGNAETFIASASRKKP